jgi:hypothetical protein
LILDDDIVWVGLLLVALYLTDLSWDHLPFTVGKEVAYASILAWLRASTLMLLSGIVWAILGLLTGTANNCSDAFGACYTSPLYSATTTGVANTITFWLPYLFYGIGVYFCLVGVVMLLILVLPYDRIPKSLFHLGD